MESKVCFKCHRELPLTEFYRHPQMGDGHLNKCKDCTKKDVHENYERRIESPAFVEKERARGREKYKRLYAGLKRVCPHCSGKNTKHNLNKLGIITTGFEVHHWNYNYSMDIFLLTPRQHKKVHAFLKFNEETQCFKYGDKILLTKDEHRKMIQEVLGVNDIVEYSF